MRRRRRRAYDNGTMPQFQALQDLHVEERVLLVVRRHRLMLWRRGWPGVAFLTALCLLAGAVNYVGAQPILSVLGPLMVIVGVWLVWVWADWQADALVLTDRRLLLIERSPFIREHRWEAHLLNIENVSAVSRGPFSQLLGCSDLVLDTASRGVQRFEFVARANDTAAAIIEVQSHAARRAMRLKRARRNAGLHTRRAAPDPSPWTTLVWRRHIWKVVLASAMPLALLIVASMIASGLPIPWLGIAGGAAALGWEAWILIDWRNDEIVSGPEKVVQTRRRPFMFGEESWQAHLDKVQDVSYLIPNFWAHFLDYGTVTILTAATPRTWRSRACLIPGRSAPSSIVESHSSAYVGNKS
ncbi:MAG: PH domain-containing protein [Chloroflexia bacterium]